MHSSLEGYSRYGYLSDQAVNSLSLKGIARMSTKSRSNTGNATPTSSLAKSESGRSGKSSGSSPSHGIPKLDKLALHDITRSLKKLKHERHSRGEYDHYHSNSVSEVDTPRENEGLSSDFTDDETELMKRFSMQRVMNSYDRKRM